MLSAVFKRRAQRERRKEPLLDIPFKIECSCGKTLSGERRREAFTQKCTDCGALTLIFPYGPLVQLRQTIREGLLHPRAREAEAAPKLASVWRKPILAASVALTIVIVAFLIMLKSSFFQSPPNVTQRTADDNSLHERIAEGQQAVERKDFRKAAVYFHDALLVHHRKNPTPDEPLGRWLEQMERESAAMADLLDISIGEMLQRAEGMSPAAWKDQFSQRYLERTVLFDALVHHVGNGIFRIDYPFAVAGQPVRVEIHNPALLKSLKVNWPQRLLVSVRLSEARTERGQWLVIGQPHGVVLFTRAAFIESSSVSVDADLAEVLKKQAALQEIAPP